MTLVKCINCSFEIIDPHLYYKVGGGSGATMIIKCPKCKKKQTLKKCLEKEVMNTSDKLLSNKGKKLKNKLNNGKVQEMQQKTRLEILNKIPDWIRDIGGSKNKPNLRLEPNNIGFMIWDLRPDGNNQIQVLNEDVEKLRDLLNFLLTKVGGEKCQEEMQKNLLVEWQKVKKKQ